MDQVSIRAAQATDVDAAVPLIFSSGPACFDYVFTNKNNAAEEFLKYAFQKKGGEFSYDNHFVLLKENSVIGIGAIFDGKRASQFTIADGLKILRFYKFKCGAVVGRGLRIERIIRLPKKEEICLGHIGISRDERGKGYGQYLMNELMKKKPLSENQYFILDVSEKNPRAKSLYDRMGFEVKVHNLSKLKSKFGYVANHFRMVKK